uniref:Uncharacterized protein n=1 Tax=Strongyloides venezuelensis TaxID=75913 RepID=A0A0K0FIY0_STRVS
MIFINLFDFWYVFSKLTLLLITTDIVRGLSKIVANVSYFFLYLYNNFFANSTKKLAAIMYLFMDNVVKM